VEAGFVEGKVELMVKVVVVAPIIANGFIAFTA